MKSLLILALLCILILGGVFLFFRYQESNYGPLMERALKRQQDNAMFVEFDGQIEPELPEADLNSKTILGIDEDGNGIRDDIDIWINRMGYEVNERMAMRQLASSFQNELKACEEKRVADEVVPTIESSKACLSLVSDYQRKEEHYLFNRIEILMFNTPARRECHKALASNQMINQNDSCQFEIKFSQNVIEANQRWLKNRN